MPVDVIVLNGGSSSGKSSIAACLQDLLDGSWLTLGIDDLIRALSHGPEDMTAGGTMEFRPDGSIVVHEAFRRAERAWYEGLAAIARAGTRLIVDEVFLDGGASQARLARAFGTLNVLWVGVRCRLAEAEAREVQRGDRIRGQTRWQADRVHDGVRYDIEVDTTTRSSAECAATIAAIVR